MGKDHYFKLRLSRVIPLFQSCRSKDPSNLPENPVPVFFHLSPVNPKSIDSNFPLPLKPHHHQQQQPSLKRQVSSAILSVGCGCGSKSDDKNEISSEFRWKKEEKWHVVAKVQEDTTPRRKIYNSSVSGDSEEGELNSSSEFHRITTEKKKNKKVRNKKKKTRQRVSRFSTSSADSGWFSSEGGGGGGGEENEEETETLVSSSRTFSTDSSFEFDTRHLETIRESPIHDLTSRKKKKKNVKRVRTRVKRYPSNRKGGSAIGSTVDDYGSPETESPARLSVFQRLMTSCKVEGKVKESFAVVKKSQDPYEDFRRSMLEMILEKQMFEARDLEQLLHCFLSLNSKNHHQIIVEAFSEIWEFLFCTTSSPMHVKTS
ncbi:Ovate protein family [Macleaya cordata]|uniref:Transcription repressor n=1 Tax=Macleaya cordata TaxID=56857 RepID=A0A200R7K6_MACCD|nr:Ovate protein family [Macleaya cordata]